MEYDKHAIGIYKSENSKSLVGHLPMEISCLLTNVLNAGSEKKLEAICIMRICVNVYMYICVCICMCVCMFALYGCIEY